MVPNSYPQFGVLVVWNEEKKVSGININVIPKSLLINIVNMQVFMHTFDK